MASRKLWQVWVGLGRLSDDLVHLFHQHITFTPLLTALHTTAKATACAPGE